MPRNDPTDTGGLFVGRRPGTAPLRYRDAPVVAGGPRRGPHAVVAAFLLVVETLLCLTSWVLSRSAGCGSARRWTTPRIRSSLGILSAFAGMLATLMITLALAMRLDHAWKLVRRAAGHEQKRGALERIFVISAGIAAVALHRSGS